MKKPAVIAHTLSSLVRLERLVAAARGARVGEDALLSLLDGELRRRALAMSARASVPRHEEPAGRVTRSHRACVPSQDVVARQWPALVSTPDKPQRAPCVSAQQGTRQVPRAPCKFVGAGARRRARIPSTLRDERVHRDTLVEPRFRAPSASTPTRFVTAFVRHRQRRRPVRDDPRLPLRHASGHDVDRLLPVVPHRRRRTGRTWNRGLYWQRAHPEGQALHSRNWRGAGR